MVLPNHAKGKSARIENQVSYEEKLVEWKGRFFEAIYYHLRENENGSPYSYYLLVLLEQLSLMWFVLHPSLQIFGDVYLIQEMRVVLRGINFYEYLTEHPQIYVYCIGGVAAYLLLQLLLIGLSLSGLAEKSNDEAYKYIRKIVNFQLLFTVKVLSGPIIGLTLNVIYCTPQSPYHNHICYDPLHMAFCVLSALIFLIIIAQTIIFSLFYYIKNPLSGSYLAQQNRYFMLSKTLLKILMPLYFAVDINFKLIMVFMYCSAGVLGLYIFWHRLFSIHTYQQRHFYVEYYMQATLFWIAANNIISYYIEGPETEEKMSLIYALFSSLLFGILMVNIQKTFENKFTQEGLQSKVKKQNMEKFVYVLIEKFLHAPPREAKLTFRVYSKLIMKHIAKGKESICHEEPKDREEVYQFLCLLIEDFIKQNGSVMLKTLKCYLLCYLGQKSYGVHQSLELQEERLGIVDQFMLYQFRKSQNIFESEPTQKVSRDFVKFYRFHQELGILQETIEVCALNNLQYWQELCQSDPSVAKLRNLATYYNLYFNKITQQYKKVSDLYPQSVNTANLYLSFLLNIGVDIRQALKIKQKLGSLLEGQRKVIKDEQGEIGEDEDVSIVTLDSIGSNLGVIMNCNSHLKNLLGFDRQGLIGKNVTKLMPKIYGELHNQFMLNFVRSESSHLRPSTKKVYALNRSSLLIEIKLTVRMITNSENSLVIVGFMQRIASEPKKGLLMLASNSGQVLGVDDYFLKLVNYKITPKQVIQEEVRMAALMPEVNYQLLDKQGAVETVLEVGNRADEEGADLQYTKEVKLQLKGTKLYQGIKISFLTVADIHEMQNGDDPDYKVTTIKGKYSNIQRLATPQIAHFLGCAIKEQKLKKNITSYDNLSLNATETDGMSIIEKSSDGLMKELPMARKLQEYIKNKESQGLGWLIKISYVIFIFGCSAMVVGIYLNHSAYMGEISKMYSEMKSTLDMNYYEAQINLCTFRIWCTETSNYKPKYQTHFPMLSRYITSFSKTFYSMITVTKNYPFDLEYNANTQYSFIFSTASNNSIMSKNVTLTNLDGINNYISAASSILDPTLGNTSLITRLLTQQQALYILLNGQQIIPEISSSAMRKYNQYLLTRNKDEINKMIELKSILLGLSIICLLIMSCLGNYLNRTNTQVIELYKSIKLWDINELIYKCTNFLDASGVKLSKKQRSSSLLKIFPIKTLLEIIEGQKEKEVQPKQMKEQLKEKKTFSKLKESGHADFIEDRYISQNATPMPLLTPAEINKEATYESHEAEETLLRKEEQMVNIQWTFSKRKIFLGVGVLVLLLALIIAFSLYLGMVSNLTKESQINRLKNIGQVRKSLNFLNYFSNRVITNPKDAKARVLLNQQIKRFYNYTTESYEYLGDPNPILKNVYSIVQTLQQWLNQPNITSDNTLMGNYQQIDSGLQKGSKAIDHLDDTVFQPEYESSLASEIQSELIFALVMIGIICMVVAVMHGLYLQPILTQCKHSMDMLRIIPAWILQRNEKASAFLS